VRWLSFGGLVVARGSSQLAQRTLLDLPSPLTRDTDPIAEIAQPLLRAVEAVTPSSHPTTDRLLD
jgi:hypothetical protein